MTRINCGIPPKKLSNKHLIAEHREIKRIPNTIRSGKAVVKNIPEKFTLGTGHVKFFYDKLEYLYIRYNQIYEECISRGFNVQYYGDSWADVPQHLYNNYNPTKEDIQIIEERILSKKS